MKNLEGKVFFIALVVAGTGLLLLALVLYYYVIFPLSSENFIPRKSGTEIRQLINFMENSKEKGNSAEETDDNSE